MSKIPSSSIRQTFYAHNYAGCVVPFAVQEEARSIANRIIVHTDTYSQISDRFGIPYWVVGILHCMETGMDFTKHLANGDPLTTDTVHTPRGLMAPLQPPYTFVDASREALRHFQKGWGSLVISGVPSALDFFNKWNGLGNWELTPARPSAYLWAGTSVYQSGKFTSDGTYDPNAVSKQVGAVPIMRALKLVD